MKTVIAAITVGFIALGSVAPAHAEVGEWNWECTWKDDVLKKGFCGLDSE
jgi:hypothetical protein|tara:strand:- start:549 stop:698 length:150 start_codon:yes stop_codon:yes gene_type:complete